MLSSLASADRDLWPEVLQGPPLKWVHLSSLPFTAPLWQSWSSEHLPYLVSVWMRKSQSISEQTVSLCGDLLSLISRQMGDFFTGEKNGHFTVNHMRRKKNHLHHQVASAAASGTTTTLGKVWIPWTKEEHWQTLSGTSRHVHTVTAGAPLKTLQTARTSIINKFRAAAAVMPEVLLQAFSLHPAQDDVYCCCPAPAHFLLQLAASCIIQTLGRCQCRCGQLGKKKSWSKNSRSVEPDNKLVAVKNMWNDISFMWLRKWLL